jgi:uncharacterized cupredoxin-like copper-binding protein
MNPQGDLMKFLTAILLILQIQMAFAGGGGGYDPVKAQQLLDKANVKDSNGKNQWDKELETVVITLEEFSFTPNQIRLKKEKPYKLVLQNVGEAAHYFTAEDFFKTSATRKVQVVLNKSGVKPFAEIKAPYFTAIEVYAVAQNDGLQTQTELFLIPMEEGTFKVVCTIPGHEAHGMIGEIIVE